MKCPRCGKQSTEYDENKWQCLHCGNRFVYKEESPTYHSQTNVSIQGSSLFDVEPYDLGNEGPYGEPYLNRHPEELDELNQAKRKSPLRLIIEFAGWFGAIFLWLVTVIALLAYMNPIKPWAPYDTEDGWREFEERRSSDFAAFFILLLLAIVLTVILLGVSISRKKQLRKLEMRVARLRNHKELVGWVAICPSCKEDHSRYRFTEKNPTSGPAHCSSCGKQFMLVEGRAHVIKH